ncbi:hypothetical protein [Streptomyces sp. NPDC050287]|uniref:hypothetical protein n=1 Tax=Streptomyces sp. NPDC050287 TaxID=3365608 RepID=UPI00378F21E9
MMRLRIQVAHCPGRAVVLTDTPRPGCPDCWGDGVIATHYGDENGEYLDTDVDPCGCWNETRRWVLLPLPRRPRWLRRRDTCRDPWGPGGYSSEPPF